MNYDWVFSFAVFAEHLNFTRAAEQLHISQPALHVQIRKLGESVGRPLYRRRGRSLELTEQGRRLAAFGREVRERGEEVLAELRGGASAGPVVLAAGQGAYLYLLGPAIRRFPKHKWTLRLTTLSGPAAIDAVREARAHLAVAAVADVPAELASEDLCDVGQAVVVPRSHGLAKKRRARLRDLAGEQIVVAPAGSPHRVMLEAALKTAATPWRVAVEAMGWELMIQFARIGMGIAIVNDFCTVPRGMVRVPLPELPAVSYRMVWREGLANPGAEALRTGLRETVAR